MSDAMQSNRVTEIVLLGDLDSHLMLVREPDGHVDDPPYRPYRRGQHQPLLPAMIEAALGSIPNIRQFAAKDHILPASFPRPPGDGDTISDICGQRISVLDLFPPRRPDATG